uniref:asparagine--tRNA ligase n=2 Tax=Lygus hesperus TaxID=30085 RepID=A0A146LUL5_LYGHE
MFKKYAPSFLSKFRGSMTSTTCRSESSFRRIADLKSDERNVSIKGWISALRKMKDNVFVDVIDGSSYQPLQVVLFKSDAPEALQYGCSVKVKGDLVKNKNSQIEMQNSELEVIGQCDLGEGFPFAPRKKYSMDYVRQFLHFRPRYSGFNSLFRLRNEATSGIHAFYKEKGYINVHTPILTSNDCEGAGEVFVVDKPPRRRGKNYTPEEPVRFFDDEAYLTVSGQLHLEVAARGLGQVYCFGPTFRAENSKSRLHLSEFYMLEAETTTLDSLEELTEAVQDLVHSVTNHLIHNCSEDLEICRKTMGDSNLSELVSNVEDMLAPFPTMTYDEAAQILLSNSDKLKTRFSVGENFTKEHELFLVRHNNNVPVFIVEWPRKIKPFYMKSMKEDSNKVLAFDLLCPNVGEVCGGSFREDDLDHLSEVLKKNRLSDKLDWYLELRKFGNVATCGYGLGFERYLQVLLQILNIKDVIPFPRWPHNCRL